MAPRGSGGVAHAMAVSVCVDRLSVCARSRNRRESGTYPRAERSADLPDNPVPLVREILVTKSHSFRGDHATDPASIASTIVARLWARIRATSCTSSEAPTITPSMLDLSSAPCQARRFAPPARTRGLRALTMPARRSVLAITVCLEGVLWAGNTLSQFAPRGIGPAAGCRRTEMRQQIDQIFV